MEPFDKPCAGPNAHRCEVHLHTDTDAITSRSRSYCTLALWGGFVEKLVGTADISAAFWRHGHDLFSLRPGPNTPTGCPSGRPEPCLAFSWRGEQRPRKGDAWSK